jgi:hypothetical protein
MILEQTVTWLEMTSPDELRPGRPPPAPVELAQVDRSLVPLLRATSNRVGQPHGWTSRPAWSEAQWAEHLGRGFRVVRAEVRRKEAPAPS